MPEPKTALITGAGSGIGRATADRLLDDGREVILVGRTEANLVQTAAGRRNAHVHPADVTDNDAVHALFQQVGTNFGRLDVLFANAGAAGPAGAADELDVNDFEDCLRVNVIGVFACISAAMALMRAQDPQGGRIFISGSIAAHAPRPRTIAYTTAKHALTGMTRSIELDGRACNVRATQIDIGNAATDMSLGATVGLPQPDGRVVPEARFDPAHVAELIARITEMPLDVTVPFVTISASGMPYIGRG